MISNRQIKIESLYLRQFRKLADRRFDFAPGVNVLVGPNAQGKTTVLEALYFLITGRSFRTSRLSDLFQTGSSRFDLACDFIKGDSPTRLTVSVEPDLKQITYHDTRSNSLNVLLGLIVGSVMTPDDSHLIKGSPQVRREFIDTQISETDPLYSWHLSRYQRAMKQRNALLKARQLTTCESWEHEMAVSAAYIHKSRQEAVKLLEAYFQIVYSRLQASEEKVGISFVSQGPEDEDLDEEFFRKQWAKLRERETHLGYTSLGPHKDDLEILIHDKAAKAYASEGQKQTLLSALKLAEWRRLYEMGEEMPLFMIDDVGLGLDRTRRERLFKEVASMGQVFITTTDARDLADTPITLHEI